MPNVCQAVPIAPNQVFLSKGYGLGATLVQLDRAADATLAAHTVWASRKVMKTKISNVTVQDGYVYGLSDGILECIELATGLSQWKEGRYGHGQLLRVRDLLLVLTEKGEVVLIEATPAHPNNVLGRFQALEGLTWNNIALDGPYLLVRNAEEAACYKLPLEVKP
jgi:outer membrane protein assembly factor BamB